MTKEKEIEIIMQDYQALRFAIKGALTNKSATELANLGTCALVMLRRIDATLNR